jgi:hypothetical protein
MSTRRQVRALLRGSAKSTAEVESGVHRVAPKEPDLVETNPFDTVVAAAAAAPRDAYWARRLVDLVRDPMTAWRFRSELAAAVCAWAQRDASFFVHERYLSEQLAVWAWPREVFIELEGALRLHDPSLTHLVMGRLWLEARRTPQDLLEFYKHALRHLRLVERPFRIGAWAESMCEALGVAEPKELARRAKAILATASPSTRERALLAILRGAARAGDWNLYDAHRRAYGTTRADTGVSNGELAALDGQRAEQDMSLRYRVPVFENEAPFEETPEVTGIREFSAMVDDASTTKPPRTGDR